MTRTIPDPDGRSDVAAAIRAAHDELCEAMVLADVAGLDVLLADGFTLTHMSGSVQRKADWLSDLDTGRMQYHSVGTVDAVVADKAGAHALTARTRTDATIWGSHGTWRLQLRSWFELRDSRWIITRTVASTW